MVANDTIQMESNNGIVSATMGINDFLLNGLGKAK